MFKFNFNIEQNGERDESDGAVESITSENESQSTPESGFFYANDVQDEPNAERRAELDSYASDLVPNVYEGGFKTWECAHDLVDYLQSISGDLPAATTTAVLEIGCGSGLPGRELNKRRQCLVDFQDFNREVLEETRKQLVHESQSYNNRMFFGDWADLMNTIPGKHYDIILTSETIYNLSNYPKLLNLFDHALKPQGMIYLAAKVYYFGVQGGVRVFEEFVKKSGLFEARVVRVIDANVKREILALTRLIR